MKYKLLQAQKEFIEVPHSHPLDVALYQGGFGSGKTQLGRGFNRPQEQIKMVAYPRNHNNKTPPADPAGGVLL